MGNCSSCSSAGYQQPYLNEVQDFYQYHADAAKEVKALRQAQAVDNTDNNNASKTYSPRPVINDTAASVSISDAARQLSAQ